MHTMHPTLLIGPSDWDPARLPREEFDARLARLWQVCPDAGGVIVWGNPAHHGELAYLTHLVPKLEGCLAFIATDGSARVLFGGGPSMIGSIRPLTWIEDLKPIRGAGAAAAEWIKTLSASPVIVNGDAMPAKLRQALDDANGRPLEDVTVKLRTLMQKKSPRELAAIGEACAMLADGMQVLRDAWRTGESAVACLLAAEHALQRAGAQDVRSLFSLDGGRTLRPFEQLNDSKVDPLQIYLAVRHAHYWADGFALLSHKQDEAANAAARALRALIDVHRAGTPPTDIETLLSHTISPFALHPVTRDSMVRDLSISLDGADRTIIGAKDRSPRYVSLHVGLSDGETRYAILSAILSHAGDAAHVVWTAADLLD